MKIVTHTEQKYIRCRTWIGRMALLLAGAFSLSADAATDMENEINKAPMPHEAHGASGAMVKVHLVSTRGYLEGHPGNATTLASMRREVDDCVRRNQERGLPSKPPRAWPEHVNSSRIDTYSAINRTIRYISGLAYAVDQRDCSLFELRSSTAKLHSVKGTCDIDFLEKTAHGACDASGQADAAPPKRLPNLTMAQIEAAERNAANNPAMAILAAATRRYPNTGTGERKTIAGLECEVWPHPFDPTGTVCLSRGGSFVAEIVSGEFHHSGMGLEITSIAGIKSRAILAKLDTLVSNAVFTPYLAGGIQVSARGARR